MFRYRYQYRKIIRYCLKCCIGYRRYNTRCCIGLYAVSADTQVQGPESVFGRKKMVSDHPADQNKCTISFCFPLFVPLPRKLQPGVRHHPQEEPLPPAGQPAVRRLLHPEGPAEEEEEPRRHLQDQLSGDHLHGGLAAGRACRARDPEGQPGGHTRYGSPSPPVGR